MSSSSGGYLQPTATSGFPDGLNMTQFIQKFLVGISAIPGPLVRPMWQVDPPKNPDLTVNWMAFGVKVSNFENSFVGFNQHSEGVSQRQISLEVSCSLYGPAAIDNAFLIQDNLLVQQNIEELVKSNMTVVSTSEPMHVPDLVNERFIDRIVMSIFMRRQIDRSYDILPIASVEGTVETTLDNQEYILPFGVPEEEP